MKTPIQIIKNRAALCLVAFIILTVSTMVENTVYAAPSEIEPTRLIIGDDFNYPPYSFYDDQGRPAGFNIEIAKAAAEAMGYQVEFKLAPWADVKSALINSEIDLISGMFYSKERDQVYDFTTKHSVASGDIFVTDNQPIKSLEALRGKQVVIQKGDIIGGTLKTMDLQIEFVEVGTVKEGIELLATGKYQYAALFKLPAMFEIKDNKYRQVKASNLLLSPGNYCFAVKNGNEDVLLNMNAGLQILKATGQYDQIYDKWLGVYEEKTLADVWAKYHWLILLGIGVVLVLIGTIGLLRYLIHRKTVELQCANEELVAQHEELLALHEEQEASMEELTAIEEELREQFNKLIESERKLKESEERNLAIIEAMPDLIFTINKDGVFLECQASQVDELLMPKTAYVGKRLTEVYPQEIADRGQIAIIRALETHELQNFDYDLVVDGDRRIYEMRIVKCRENEVVAFTRNISTQRRYQEKIEFLSYHDQLTGLYNRRFFEEELERLDHQRNYPLCLIMADVNGLKLINDSFGHLVGDELLIKMADVLKKACRADEIISRIGGDEFVILMPNTDKAQAEQVLKRIKAVSENEQVAGIDLSVSFGVEVKSHSEEDIHEVFNRAENSMYKQKLFEGPSMRGKTIGAIIHTLHEKNIQAEEHSKRVSELCENFARVLDMPQRDIEEIKTVGLLHDIGKIGIDEILLNKPGKLTTEEYEEMKRHPEIGYRILKSVNDMSDMADYVLGHHEHWNGSGYPRGIKGNDIPLQSRMIAIVDAFDAMTSVRSYKVALTQEEAVSELRKKAGSQFDPELIEPFVNQVLGLSVEVLSDIESSV